MSTPAEQTTLTVALIGNPNTGKSTLFSALVGIHQHVGNYPGVTVEKRTGRMNHGGCRYELIDLPGLYSLAPRSRDEMVAVDVLLGRCADCPPVDAVVCIVDAGNLQRNFYLLSQVLELGLPTVLAVNMLDVAKKHGITLDMDRLKRQLAIPVVAMQANRRIGIPELKTALAEIVHRKMRQGETPFPEPFEREVTQLGSLLAESAAGSDEQQAWPRCLVRRLLLDSSGYLEKALLSDSDDRLGGQLEAARARLAAADCEVPGIETTARYAWARRVLHGVVTEPSRYKTTATDRIDRLLTHRVWGTLIFAALMVVVFQSVFTWANRLTDLIKAAFGVLGGSIEAHVVDGTLRSLLVDGVIGGVGGVVSFLPQILILFLFIAVLEDCGYMARAALLMDKMMARVGLSGKSFIPMLSSFACAVPGIMAARVIENERDRLTTILVAPLMTCSARLPVYTLLIAAFIPGQNYLGGLLSPQGITLMALYLLGIVAAVVAALILKKTILQGETPPFLMELPSYKWPSVWTVFHRVTGRGWVFLRTAGTLILAVSILVWAALYFPHNEKLVKDLLDEQRQLQAELKTLRPNDLRHDEASQRLAQIPRDIKAEYQANSILGHMGHVVEPLVKPLGWDWRIGCAVIASFPAREVVVATLAVIYKSEEGEKQLGEELRNAEWDGSHPPRKVFNVPVALSILVFYALCAQCAATLAVIKRETNSWRWPAFTFAYMTALAYLGALVTYQLGMWISS